MAVVDYNGGFLTNELEATVHPQNFQRLLSIVCVWYMYK